MSGPRERHSRRCAASARCRANRGLITHGSIAAAFKISTTRSPPNCESEPAVSWRNSCNS
eukprot:scaffold15486_cov111-Isochrysis_galbana.AAC.15